MPSDPWNSGKPPNEKLRKERPLTCRPNHYRVVSTDDTCWGAPRLAGTRLTVAFVVGRFAAGESIPFLAQDYGIEPAAVETMIRAVCLAAYGRRGMFANVERELMTRAVVEAVTEKAPAKAPRRVAGNRKKELR